VCGAPTLAKCGEKNIWHWAHKSKRNCDKWWENETEWHRDWKNRFPVEWQEVVQRADDGEKHIADVKTGQGWVIEFQHSHLKLDERRSREVFYKKMLWVVNGLRRQRDLKQFVEAVRDHRWEFRGELAATISHEDSRIVDEWSNSRVPVFFNFGEEVFEFDIKYQPRGLWLYLPMGLSRMAHLFLVDKESFVDWHRQGYFDLSPFVEQVKTLEIQRKREMNAQVALRPTPQRLRRTRRQFRF